MSVLRGLMRTVTWMQVYHAPDERVTLEIAPVKSDVLPPGFPPTNEPLSPGTFRSPTGPGGDLQEEFASVPEFFPWQYESKTAAAWWAGHLAEKRWEDIPQFRLKKFEDELRRGIERRCTKCWFQGDPQRGSGLRSVSNSDEQRCDPIIVEAAAAAGIRGVESRLPRCVLWVNPGQVRYCMDGTSHSVNVET